MLLLLAMVAVVVMLVVNADGSGGCWLMTWVGGCYHHIGGQCTVVVAVVWLTMWVVAIVIALVVDTDGSGGVVNDVGRWPLCGQ